MLCRLIPRLIKPICLQWLISACLATGLHAGTYLDDLRAAALEQGLADDPEWRTLGHYLPRSVPSGYQSLVDDPAFFIASQGKTDPTEELAATLGAFFDEPPTNDVQHPQCAFIARYRWLKSRLDFDPKRLREYPCERFQVWREEINAAELTLVFPAAFFNNPASMFGHTFLRLDPAGQKEDTRLLSFAINYGALVEQINPLEYAFLGLTGGYSGSYAVVPYAALVRTYSDLESRDIWEYQLNFTEDEIARMIAHLWELRDIKSDYFFLDENCSYQLMFLLDAARPTLDLADAFSAHVIPLDSVRAVIEQEGLLKRAVFRPSSRTKIETSQAHLSRPEQDIVRALVAGTIESDAPALQALQPGRQATVLEIAEQLVTFQLNSGDIDRDIGAKRSWSLLRARSGIDAKSEQPAVPIPATRPDQGHYSARFAGGLGVRDSRIFQSLALRPAYHDHLDPQGGYVSGAGIDFLDIELRHYQNDRSIDLETFTLLGIRSMTPQNRVIRPISWRLRLGADRLRIENGDEQGALVGIAELGGGISYRLGNRAILSGLLETGGTVGDHCSANCSFTLGPSLAIHWPVTDRWTVHAEARALAAFGETFQDRYDVSLGQGFGLSQNLSLKLEGDLEDDGAGFQTELRSSLNWYF